MGLIVLIIVFFTAVIAIKLMQNYRISKPPTHIKNFDYSTLFGNQSNSRIGETRRTEHFFEKRNPPHFPYK